METNNVNIKNWKSLIKPQKLMLIKMMIKHLLKL